jgi:hypothetical protein
LGIGVLCQILKMPRDAGGKTGAATATVSRDQIEQRGDNDLRMSRVQRVAG